MIVICVLFGFSLTKDLKIRYPDKVDLKNNFAKILVMDTLTTICYLHVDFILTVVNFAKKLMSKI